MCSKNHHFNFLVPALLVLSMVFILPPQNCFAAGGDCVEPLGDIDGSGIVDENDLEIIHDNWLVSPCDEGNDFCDGADLDDSNSVDLLDYALFAKDWLVATNCSPVVDAGPDQAFVWPIADADLDGTVTDDGLPDPPAAVTTLWEVVSGPNDVTFDDANQVDTAVHFDGPGVYVLRLTANDGEMSTSDDVTITFHDAPVVDAGPDQQIVYNYGNPTSASLDGTVTDDGLPNPPGVVTTLWTQQSGPGTVTFADANAIDTTATFPDAGGVFVLRLDANDGAASAYDEVTITVVGKPAWSETADYYVDGLTGSDTNPGNSNQPWATITKAASTLNGTSAKDKVLVWGGGGGGRPAVQTYVGKVSPSINGTASYPNTYRRDHASGEAIITADLSQDGTLYSNGKSYFTFDGFTITNSNANGYGIYLFGDGCDNITIKNCRVRDLGRYGIYDREGDNLTINNCAVYQCNQIGSSYADIYIWGSTGAVTGCQITSCTINGTLSPNQGKYGIQALSAATIDLIRDCIVVNHKMSGGYGILEDTGATITAISYCDVWNNTSNYSTGCPTPTNSKSGDPGLDSNLIPTNATNAKPASDGGWMGYRLGDTAL